VLHQNVLLDVFLAVWIPPRGKLLFEEEKCFLFLMVKTPKNKGS